MLVLQRVFLAIRTDLHKKYDYPLMVVTPQGASYAFAKHNFNFTAQQLAAAGKSTALAGDHRDTEWAGSVFSPDGQWLFVNLYTPGITLAITGPWDRGTL